MSNEHDEIVKILQMYATPDRRAHLLDALEQGQEAIAELELREANRDEDLEELTAQLAIAESRVSEDRSALEFAREGRDKAQAALLTLGWDYSIDSAEWAKQHGAETEELAVNLAIVQERFAFVCLELANISAAIDPSGKAAEFLMTAWGDEHGSLGELTAKQVAKEASRLLRTQTVKLRSEELAMLEYLQRRSAAEGYIRHEPVSRWTLHDVVDQKHRTRNCEAADRGIILLERLGLIAVKIDERKECDLISLVPNAKDLVTRE